MANNFIPCMAVTYVQSTGEHASAHIYRPSGHGDNHIHLKYMRNGKEIEHNAAFDKVLFPIRSPLPSPYEGSPTRLLERVSRACTAFLSMGWALNRRFDQTFGTAAVLAQGGGVYWSSASKGSDSRQHLVGYTQGSTPLCFCCLRGRT